MNIIKKELYEPATVELEYFHLLLQFLSGRDSSLYPLENDCCS